MIFVPPEDEAQPEVVPSEPEPEAESRDEAPEPVEVPEVGSAADEAEGNV